MSQEEIKSLIKKIADQKPKAKKDALDYLNCTQQTCNSSSWG